MRKVVFLAAGLTFASTVLQAQTERGNIAFQYFFAGEGAAAVKLIGMEGVGGKVVTGRPVSGTEERHTLQVLGDGTRIDNKETDQFFRDSLGRTRIERSNGAITIQNPVDGFIAEMNSNQKTARRINMQMRGNAVYRIESDLSPQSQDQIKMKIAAEQGAMAMTYPPTAVIARRPVAVSEPRPAEKNSKAAVEENLGFESVNGVTAEGTRSTITIAAGQIGNDKPINVVSERWFSTDLQMLVKSVNSDPRFGETTYQLTNITQGAPDPSLFQIPADYTTPQTK